MIPNYSVVVKWSEEDNEFVAIVPELPLVSGLAPTREKAVKECMIAAGMVVDSLKDEGRRLPKPSQIVEYSGQLRLRMPRFLHGQLAGLAEQEGMSLNSYIVYLLTRATATHQTDAETRAMVGPKRKQAGQRRLARTA
jgi:predicted RNase H-like HicB family nuclease